MRNTARTMPTSSSRRLMFIVGGKRFKVRKSSLRKKPCRSEHEDSDKGYSDDYDYQDEDNFQSLVQCLRNEILLVISIIHLFFLCMVA